MCQFVLIQYRCEHTELTAGPICQAMFIELTRANIDPTSWTIEGCQNLPFHLPDACSPTGQNTLRVVSTHWCGWECENTYYSDLAAIAAEGRVVAQQLAELNIDFQGQEVLQAIHGALFLPEGQPQAGTQDQAHQQATRTTEAQEQAIHPMQAQTQAPGPAQAQAQAQTFRAPQAQSQAAQAQAARPPNVQNQAIRPPQSQAQAQMQSQAMQAQGKTAEPRKDRPQEMKDAHANYRATQPTQIRAPAWANVPGIAAPANENSGSGSSFYSDNGTYGGSSYGSDGNGNGGNASGFGRGAYTGPGNGLLDAVRNRDLARARARENSRGRTYGSGSGASTGTGNGTGGAGGAGGGVSLAASMSSISATTSDASRYGGALLNASPYRAPDAHRQPQQHFGFSNAGAGAAPSYAGTSGRYAQAQPQTYANVDANHGHLGLARPVSRGQPQPRGAPVAAAAGTGRAQTHQGGIREALGLNAHQQGVTPHVHWQQTHVEEDDDDDEYEDCSSDDDDDDIYDEHVTFTMSAENMADGDVFN